jgi:hypothetical protein
MGLDLTCQQVASFRLRFCAFVRSEHRCRAINGSGSAELSNRRKLHDQSPRGIHDRSVAAFEHLVAVRGGNRPAHLTFRPHAISCWTVWASARSKHSILGWCAGTQNAARLRQCGVPARSTLARRSCRHHLTIMDVNSSSRLPIITT